MKRKDKCMVVVLMSILACSTVIYLGMKQSFISIHAIVNFLLVVPMAILTSKIITHFVSKQVQTLEEKNKQLETVTSHSYHLLLAHEMMELFAEKTDEGMVELKPFLDLLSQSMLNQTLEIQQFIEGANELENHFNSILESIDLEEVSKESLEDLSDVIQSKKSKMLKLKNEIIEKKTYIEESATILNMSFDEIKLVLENQELSVRQLKESFGNIENINDELRNGLKNTWAVE